ncbi:beta-1,3-galactosyltransferase 1-like [Cherax quadricarinatus]|uniref:beta-1,3-galactosyltransferase 1-like n=1 Tax=Cherax quadricarinatus TaxID=27406 RepID=UPI002379791C|nr:beta-1,3-galactosyltransferase 1-like [Cherax quadricarinatus]
MYRLVEYRLLVQGLFYRLVSSLASVTPTIHTCKRATILRKSVVVPVCLIATVLLFYSCLLSFQPLSLLFYFLPGCYVVSGGDGSQKHTSPAHFVIEESDFCHRRPDLFIVAYVHSSIASVEKRMDTRTTWASAGAYDSNVKMAVVFMVGLAKTTEEQNIVNQESILFRDIVQGNYTDTYHLLSHKALTSLQWVTQHCSHVPWILHADDDVLIDIFLLSKFLESSASPHSFLCYTWETSEVRRIGRWCVRPEEFPESMYPPYCGGGAWAMATPLVSRLLKAATHAPFLWVDDAYITGVLAKYADVGHSNELKKYIRREGIAEDDLGKMMIWFELNDSRKKWWLRLLLHHKYLVL